MGGVKTELPTIYAVIITSYPRTALCFLHNYTEEGYYHCSSNSWSSEFLPDAWGQSGHSQKEAQPATNKEEKVLWISKLWWYRREDLFIVCSASFSRKRNNRYRSAAEAGRCHRLCRPKVKLVYYIQFNNWQDRSYWSAWPLTAERII